ncbi:hypothetical protein KJ877_01495 [bacterium]|nr:hypothetical protein [bacterium]MBU1989937.1 hypothetical protein [bacterium]
MSLLPENATKVDVRGATVDFSTYVKNGVTYYQFDTSACVPPEPMVNAMCGLQLIDSTDHKLVMINHKKPMALLEKVSQNYQIDIEYLDDGRIKMIFTQKVIQTEPIHTDDTVCKG